MGFSKLLSLLVLILNTGDVRGAEGKSSIIGGENAKKGDWPWMVYLNLTADGITKWRCGATILNDEWLLTAANCWDKNPEPKFSRSMAWVGTHNVEEASARFMGIETVMSHPGYRNLGGRFLSDIALVKLKKKVKFSKDVREVGLPNVDDTFDSSSECWITGWGYIDNDVPLQTPQTLQQLKIGMVSEEACKAWYPELTSDMVCAGAGGKGPCQGDYGGPLVCRKGSGFVQVGIMSYGSPDGCGLPGRPAVFTEVSKFLRFIRDYTHRHPEEVSAEV